MNYINDDLDLDNPMIEGNDDFLKASGLINYINVINEQNKKLSELLSLSINLFNKHTIKDLMEYLVQVMLKKLVPETLTFIFQDYHDENNTKVISYDNLVRIDAIIEIITFKEYKNCQLTPIVIKFNDFIKLVKDEKLLSPFRILEPEIVIPMIGLDGLFGFIILGNKISMKDYTESEIDFINRLMNFMSVTLQNIIYYERVISDQKTGLYSHSYFLKKLEEELARIKRKKKCFSILMIDVDHFKDFNDTYGHIAGDVALKEIADILKGSLRIEDVVARFGGEEFVVMLTETDMEHAFHVSERVRKLIEKNIIRYMDKEMKVTISIGLHEVDHNSADAPKYVMKCADEALYESKKNGRNKTSIYKKPGTEK